MSKNNTWLRCDNRQFCSIKQIAGFTLVELLIVIVILGILASVLIVGISSIMCTSKESATSTLMKNVGMALDQYKVYKNKYPATSTAVGPDIFSSKPVVDELKLKGPNNEPYYFFKEEELYNGGIKSKVFEDKMIKYRNNSKIEWDTTTSKWKKEGAEYIFKPEEPDKIYNLNRFDMWTSGCGEAEIEGKSVKNW